MFRTPQPISKFFPILLSGALLSGPAFAAHATEHGSMFSGHFVRGIWVILAIVVVGVLIDGIRVSTSKERRDRKDLSK